MDKDKDKAKSDPRKYQSALDRLLALPAIFTLNTMVRATGMSREVAKVALSRWAEKGLIENAGPRAGIYFNRLVDRSGENANAVRALMIKYPSATLCGASVLHAAGWTTQIPSSVHVAIEERPSYAQIDGVTLHPRPVSWFRSMQNRHAFANQAKSGEDSTVTAFGLRSLSPAWALGDLYADGSKNAWHPDEDDLDIPDKDLAKLVKACTALGVTPDWLAEQAGDDVESPEVTRPRERG